jgi:CubicO group peptidase (beta-lactamase class C family)
LHANQVSIQDSQASVNFFGKNPDDQKSQLLYNERGEILMVIKRIPWILLICLTLACRASLLPGENLPAPNATSPTPSAPAQLKKPTQTPIHATATSERPTAFPFSTTVPSLTPTLPPPWEWPTSSPEAQGMDSSILAKMINAMRSDGRNIHSLLVVRHGVLVLEAYFNPFHKDAPHMLASCTKSVTSALVGIAIEKRLLQSASQPAWELFPEVTLDDPQKKDITVENFLTMSSGLEWPEWETDYRSPNNPYSATTYLQNSTQWVYDQALIHKPGTVFSYNSGGSHLLSSMVSRAAGMDTLEFARRELFGPLGISQAGWDRAEDGVNLGGAGLSLLPRDMAKFGQLYLQNGNWDGHQVVPEAWVKASTEAHIPYQPGTEYGYQWWIPKGKGFTAWGWGQQNIWVVPQQDLVVVITAGMSNQRFLPNGELLSGYIIPAVRSNQALPPNPQAEAQLDKQLKLAQNPPAQPAAALPPITRQITGKTYLVTDGSITLGLQSFLFKDFSANEAHVIIGVTHEDMEVRAGLDGVFRRSPIKNGELALKGRWLNDHTLELTWQDLHNAERAVLRLDFQGEELVVDVDLLIEGIHETSHGHVMK